MDAKAIAQQTLSALDQGHYTAPDGSQVEFAALLAACIDGTQEYNPDELSRIRDQTLTNPGSVTTSYAVVNETTLEGAARLVGSQRYGRIGVLNFASAKRPGGGFLGGAISQEESLARSSGLYPSLLQCPEYYQYHRAQGASLYSDHMIYSPACPVLRDDAGGWLPRPYVVDFITSAAPNAGAVMLNESANRARIAPTLAERAGKVLALAAHRGCDALVLGAWGCGVFQNDPATVAAIFHDALRPDGGFGRRFHHVLFAVYDTSSQRRIYSAFATRFADLL